MARKVYLGVVGLLLISLLLVVFGCAPRAPAKVYTFKYAAYYSPEHPTAKNYEQYFMTRATQLSKNQIQWQYFPSSQMGPGTDQLDIVGGGAAEAGTVIPAFFTGKLPLTGVQDLPFLFNTDVVGHIRLAVKMMHQPDYAGAWEKFKVKLLVGGCQGTMCMYFKQPLTKLEDWKGRKVRTAGKLQSDAVKLLGGSPQSLLSAEVYLALSTGVLDGSLWQPNSAVIDKVPEVCSYAVIPPISFTGYTIGILINLDLWKGLSPDLQEALRKAAEDTEKNCEVFVELEKQAIAELKQKGMTIYYLPKEENDRWRQATKPLWNDWLAANGEPGKRLVDFMLKELGEK